VSDGEGVRTVIRLSRRAGQGQGKKRAQVAQTVAHSLLVKTAWAGADPNWGRILAAVGRSGSRVDPTGVSIMIAINCVPWRVACAFDEKPAAHQGSFASIEQIRIRLQRGRKLQRSASPLPI